ncbi:MAG: hypothetical protein GAK32_01803 [Pseudomonas fluorescens]|nr:MAG: hypothetical protein GAK32_01803 [Pseudomonas fluorescens]
MRNYKKLYGRLPFGKGRFDVMSNRTRLQFCIRPLVQADTCWP